MNDITVPPACYTTDQQTITLRLNTMLHSGLHRLANDQATTPEFALTVILAEKMSSLEHADWLRQTHPLVSR